MRNGIDFDPCSVLCQSIGNQLYSAISRYLKSFLRCPARLFSSNALRCLSDGGTTGLKRASLCRSIDRTRSKGFGGVLERPKANCSFLWCRLFPIRRSAGGRSQQLAFPSRWASAALLVHSRASFRSMLCISELVTNF
jgi:hypothetical protein